MYIYLHDCTLQVVTVYAMEILMSLLGAAGFVLCLWGSILGCMTGDCCTHTPVVHTVLAQLQALSVRGRSEFNPLQQRFQNLYVKYSVVY